MEESIRCPRCLGGLDWDGAVCCRRCGVDYPIENGTPVLLAEVDDHKRNQALAHDVHDDPEGEIERPYQYGRFFQRLMDEKISRGVSELGDLRGATALCVCAGSGYDAEQLARRGARVIASDISQGACVRAAERGRRHGVEIMTIAADAERLPFADQSVDLVYVHDGLHHLADPMNGVAEMCRVSRKFVSINEPARSPITHAATKVGLAEEVEESGNVVARLDRTSVEDALRSNGFEVLSSATYAMFYRHTPGRVSEVLDRAPTLGIAALRGLQPVIGRVGNKLAVQARRT